MTNDQRTVDAVYEWWKHEPRRLPTREALKADDRVLLVCWEGIGKHGELVPAGLFSSAKAACESYDWISGAPEYMIDLAQPLERALIEVIVEHVRPGHTGGSLEERGLWEPEEDPDDDAR